MSTVREHLDRLRLRQSGKNRGGAKAIREAWGRRWNETKRTAAPAAIALIDVGLGDHASALDWLETAAAADDASLIMLEAYPYWDPLRSDPRFITIAERLGIDG